MIYSSTVPSRSRPIPPELHGPVPALGVLKKRDYAWHVSRPPRCGRKRLEPPCAVTIGSRRAASMSLQPPSSYEFVRRSEVTVALDNRTALALHSRSSSRSRTELHRSRSPRHGPTPDLVPVRPGRNPRRQRLPA